MDSLLQDVVYAVRRLFAAPVFTLVAVVTLALGIGANGALFSLVNGVLLRPLPYPEPDRLVHLSAWHEGKPAPLSPANFLDAEAAVRSFDAMSVYDNGGYTVTGRGEPARVNAGEVSASFFEVMGVTPSLGRGFLPDENEPGKRRSVVIGHALWQRHFTGDPAALGQSLALDGQPYVVVGVAPEGFDFPMESELWVPLAYDARFREARGAWYLGGVGRVAKDASLDQARAELLTIGTRLARAHPENENLGLTATQLRDHLVGDVRRPLLVLLGAVGFVLLIACVNVANLLLARHTARATELAVRTALGASRVRLVRQLLTEALVLGLAGGALGVAGAHWGRSLLLALLPGGDLPRLGETPIDRQVLAFCGALAVLTALVFGAFPAWRTACRDPAIGLREGGRGLLSGRGRLGRGLVVAEMALAVTLLVGAGLLLRSFVELRRVDPGFGVANALTFRTALPEALYADNAQRVAFYRALEERLRSAPGVEAVGASVGLPLSDVYFNFSFEVEGRPPLPPAQQPSLETRVVTPGYFRAIGIPIVAGRGFAETDSAEAPQVVVLSRAAARRHFPNEDPIGKRIVLGWGAGAGRRAGGEVIGIAGDVREHGLGKAHPAQVYLPFAQRPLLNMSLVLRTVSEPQSLAALVRTAVAELDSSLPVLRLASLEEVVSRSVERPRFYAALLGFFAGTALLLAALGVFGVLSYAVAQRSREIGVRLALGARPRDMVRMVLGEAMGLAGAGLLLGCLMALALARSLASLLFGLTAADPATFLGVAAALGAAALLASALPARRAARLDPLQALRSE